MAIPGFNRKSSRKSQASGFVGQRLVVVHPPQISKASRLVLLRPFCPTDIGLFPVAAHHERRRPIGISQTVFIRCFRGSGWCDLNGVRHLVYEQNLLVVPARCPHAYGASNKDPWSIEWFHAIGTGLPDYLRRLGVSRRLPILTLRPGAWSSSLFGEALSSLEAGFTDAHLLHAAQALSHLLSRLIVQQKQSIEDPCSVKARIENIAGFLQENHDRPLRVAELASMAGLSASHFASLFLKHTGYPPMDYLIRSRIEQACRLLDQTPLNIKEIAASVGYEDPYYFSRLFKKVTAYSPKNYRVAHRG
jgi:AraC-like DNA-binding protein